MNLKINLYISIAFTILSIFLIPLVHVNADMTKYLPDGSRMKEGLAIMSEEFDASAMNAASISMMFCDLTEEEKTAIKEELETTDGINSVTISNKDNYTLYTLGSDVSNDMKKVAKGIKRHYIEYNPLVRTSQDGNTPDPMLLLVGVLVLIIILVIMSKSWVEPILLLASTGMAVAMNMGTNYFLGSVSITTNSIAAILQLALSIDYSVILMNRFRQEKALADDLNKAMKNAMKHAASSIFSSSLTTIVGLLMLCFMKLKIGMDMGLVLAKGVLFSLIFTYTALPGLLLIFNKAVKKSRKRVPVFKTDGLARFSERFNIPIAIAFVAIFIASYFLHFNTEISFSTYKPSKIDDIFGRTNAIVLLYDNEDEDKVINLMDSISETEGVDSVLSYPGIMLRQQTADQMVEHLKGLGGEQASMLTEEMMHILYYAAKEGDVQKKYSFTEIVDFIKAQASGNTLLSSYLDPSMVEKLDMLDAVTGGNDFHDAKGGKPAGSAHGPQEDTQRTMSVSDYMAALYRQTPNVKTRLLSRASDREKIRTAMNMEEMSSYIGSTRSQTRMIYSLSGNNGKSITPIQFAHILTDDLFQRKALSAMVSKSQKADFEMLKDVMDLADNDTVLSLDELDALVTRFEAGAVLDRSRPDHEEDQNPSGEDSEAPEEVVDDAPEAIEEPVVEQEPEDPRLEILMQMLSPGRTYTAAQMSRNFKAMGENIDKSMMELLFMYYGSQKEYNEEWTLNLKELMEYLSGSVINDPRFAGLIPEDMKDSFSDMQKQMDEGLGQLKGGKHSIAAILTGLDDETPQTTALINKIDTESAENFEKPCYMIGESVMFNEMKNGFGKEMLTVTILTIISIFLIVAISFRSLVTPTVLVIAVMSAVFINVTVSGLGGNTYLYLAYLIVQSILMGASIDYGILFSNYYKETHDMVQSYRKTIPTIFTSGLIMIAVPGVLGVAINDAMVSPILNSLAIGTLSAVCIMLFMLPGTLSVLTRKTKDKQ